LYKTKKTGRSKMVKLGILDGKLEFQLMLYLTTWALWVHRYIQVLSLIGIHDSWCHHVIDMTGCRFGWTRGVFANKLKRYESAENRKKNVILLMPIILGFCGEFHCFNFQEFAVTYHG